MRTAVWFALCSAALGGVCGLAVWLTPVVYPHQATGETPARPRTVGALGRLEPGRGVINVSAPDASRVERLEVNINQSVRGGEVLAVLDTYDQIQSEKRLHEAMLQEALEQQEAELAKSKALIVEAEAAVRRTEEVLPEDVRVAQSQVQVNETMLEQAYRDLQRAESLRGGGAITYEELDHLRMGVQRQHTQLESARQTLARAKHDEAVSHTEARARLETARASLTSTQRGIKIESARRQLGVDEERLRRASIRAPVEGQVLRVFTYPGERVTDKPVLQLGETRHMYAVAEVHEADIRFVREGQRATVTSPSLGRELTGTVEVVGRRVFKNDVLNIDPRSDADLRVFEVRIRLDDSALAARMVYLQVEVLIAVDDADPEEDPSDKAPTHLVKAGKRAHH